MSTKTVYVLRHGEPEDRTIFYGQLDVGLSPVGEGHVRAQAEFFGSRPIRTIVSSDLSRCTRGAQAIAARCGVEVTTNAALREMHLGVLEGVPMAEALERMPELAGRSYMDMLDYAFPGGGESVRTVADRVLPVVEAVVRDAEGDIVVYVHNSVARVILAAACGLGPEGYVRFEQRYGAINRLRVDTAADTPWARSAIVYANRAP
ncbi:MAG: histidine phosphatase family protein [Nannocystaceae bacterium]|nr:histidine phosphatase family protein [bacterium]